MTDSNPAQASETQSSPARRRLIIAVTGASGAIYAIRLLRACLTHGHDVELICSEYGKRLLIEECDWNVKVDSFEDWCQQQGAPIEMTGSLTFHRESNQAASIASGSQRWDGMVVVPCSMKSLSAIAHGSASNLIERSADVTLKEGRPLIIVPRETPMNRVHLENQLKAHDAGARIVPAMPAFYQQPASFEDLADFIAGRILSLLNLEHTLFPAWKG